MDRPVPLDKLLKMVFLRALTEGREADRLSNNQPEGTGERLDLKILDGTHRVIIINYITALHFTSAVSAVFSR